MNRRLHFAAVLLGTLTSHAVVQAATLPATLKVGKQNLVLNGEGSREKYFLNLYVAGLYLPEPNRQAPVDPRSPHVKAVQAQELPNPDPGMGLCGVSSRDAQSRSSYTQVLA